MTSIYQSIVREVMRNRTAILSVTSLLIFCVIEGQILSSFASYNPIKTIAASGRIIENAADPTIRKHIAAYIVSLNDTTTDFIALNFDVVVTIFAAASTVGKIKALNPNITVFAYKDIMGMHPRYCEDWEEVNSHEDWFLHDINGNRLINKEWGWYAMDVGKLGWRSHYANFVKGKLDSSLFDGVFADDTWDQFCDDVWTVGPNNIPAEIAQRWHSDMVGMIGYVKNTIGNKLLIVNTRNSDDYVDACDGKNEEEFVHPSWYPLDEFQDKYINWKDKVDSLKNISQKGKYYLAHSGTIIPENPTEADLDKVHSVMLYCFASFLLGANGKNASFGFNDINSEDGSRGYYPEFHVPLGSPTNQYYLVGSVYARDFADGKVLVNPTQSSYTVHLDSEYETLDGKTVSNVTLDTHSGIILLRH